jgi:hypothetical protein
MLLGKTISLGAARGPLWAVGVTGEYGHVARDRSLCWTHCFFVLRKVQLGSLCSIVSKTKTNSNLRWFRIDPREPKRLRDHIDLSSLAWRTRTRVGVRCNSDGTTRGNTES